MDREKYHTDTPRLENVNLGAIVGVVAGALVGNFVHWGLASINAMIVAVACYVVLNRLTAKK